MKRTATYREAVRSGLREALRREPRAFLMGEDVGRYGGAYACSAGLLEEFGPERVRDTPLAESTFVGAGIGAALGGARPIVEVMTVNFSLLALDQIVNNAATLRHMSGGQFSIPLVVRMATGAAASSPRSTRTARELVRARARAQGPRARDGAGRARHAARRARRSRPGGRLRAPVPLPHGGRARRRGAPAAPSARRCGAQAAT